MMARRTAARTAERAARRSGRPAGDSRAQRLRTSVVILFAGLSFAAVSVQLGLLAASGSHGTVAAMTEAIARSFARPDLVDRQGRLLATDVAVPSLFADPALILNRDIVVEKLVSVMPDLDEAELRRAMADRTRRFAWIRRHLPPALAQRVHNLGLPGLSFRNELTRAYPLERLAGHMLGGVNVDNRGISGIERYIDEQAHVEAVHGTTRPASVPLRLAIDIGVQHSLEDELKQAMGRYGAKGAAGLVMDVNTGEMLASASLPGVDPVRPAEAREPQRIDRVQGGTYELGSIFKAVTVALALESGKTPDTIVDVTKPLTAGRFTISDTHPAGRPLSVAEVFIRSSNVGAGMLALEAGADRQKAFLESLGLMGTMRTEAGPVAAPQLPGRLERAEQITVSYGHGLAVAPLQFAAAAASLLNGGTRVQPTYLARGEGSTQSGPRVVSAETSRALADLFRRNVTDPNGTGRRADVPGYRVGGKTGTAEMPGRGGYREKAVISSFLAAFPMEKPRYLVMVSLFEPSATKETDGEITAGRNAAPTAARVISRTAPLLGVMPEGPLAGLGN